MSRTLISYCEEEMPKYVIGLERLEKNWQTLPWLMNYLNILPRLAEVNIKATLAETYVSNPELFAFFEILEHGSKATAYYQLVLFRETGFQILKTYAGNNLVFSMVSTKTILLSLEATYRVVTVEFYNSRNEVAKDNVEVER